MAPTGQACSTVETDNRMTRAPAFGRYQNSPICPVRTVNGGGIIDNFDACYVCEVDFINASGENQPVNDNKGGINAMFLFCFGRRNIVHPPQGCRSRHVSVGAVHRTDLESGNLYRKKIQQILVRKVHQQRIFFKINSLCP